MEYRQSKRAKIPISEIGIGAGNLHRISSAEIKELVSYGLDNGINLIDLITVDENTMEAIASAVQGRREEIQLQIHIGADFPNGQVASCRDLNQIKKEFERMLSLFNTDCIDIGLAHYIDDMQDFEHIMKSGIWDYMKDLKKQSKISQMGFCSHTLEICRKFVETGEVDCFMMGINPHYDFSERGGKLIMSQERMDFYRDCEKDGIGIHVMKPFAGGSLLNRRISHLDKPLNVYQCLQYALDRPAVQSCLVGIASLEELKEILRFYDSTREEKDYSIIGTMRENSFTESTCLYCNHCQPCPANIDIGLINRYLDLAQAGDELAKNHYHSLRVHASSCTQCGSCDRNCHFGVKNSGRMNKAAEFFGV